MYLSHAHFIHILPPAKVVLGFVHLGQLDAQLGQGFLRCFGTCLPRTPTEAAPCSKHKAMYVQDFLVVVAGRVEAVMNPVLFDVVLASHHLSFSKTYID